MLIPSSYIEISGFCLGTVSFFIYYCIKRNRNKQNQNFENRINQILIKEKKFIFLIPDILEEIMIFGAIVGAFVMIPILVLGFASTCIMTIESETVHNQYFYVGQNQEYSIELQSGEQYILNNMQDTILVHTVANEHMTYNDNLILRPGQIGLVHCTPTIFFEGEHPKIRIPVFKNRIQVYINAVDYYHQKE